MTRSRAELDAAGRALAAAGVPALVLSEPSALPSAELLVRRDRARAAERALARLGWRWRVGGERAWRLAARQRYVFDGGYVLTLHAALPTGPLPAAALRSLEQALWGGASAAGPDGLRRCRSEPLLVHLAVQVARGSVRFPAQLDELRQHAARVADWPAVWRLAHDAGVAGTLRRVLADGPPGVAVDGAPAVAPRARSVAWGAAQALRAHGRPRALCDAVIGEPWRVAVTRCRFCELELLAGPGTFLPRRVSERLVRTAAERLAGTREPLLVDVGTGCGAVALALADRLTDARVLGVDIDRRALRWARRNRRRLGLRGVRFAAGSMLDPVPAAWRRRAALVAANVPCLPPQSFEGALDAPARAYVGTGPDGLGLQRRLAEEARETLRPGGWLLVQLAPPQWPAYRDSLERLGYRTHAAHGDDVAVVAAACWPG